MDETVVTERAESIVWRSPAELKASPLNYRKTYDAVALAELAESIRRNGVLEPLIVRLLPDGSPEVAIGERRRRASLTAGAASVPTIECSWSDDQVCEAQKVENLHREAVHPFEEGQAFAELVARGLSVGEIARRHSKPSAFIARRLALARLSPAAVKAFVERAIDERTAVLVSSLPEQVQREAVEGIAKQAWQGEKLGPSRCAEYVRDKFMLRIADAPFSATDATLDSEAGACATCPKRTGNQRELFDAPSKVDLCTDAACFGKKAALAWAKLAEEAGSRGQVVLDEEQSKKVMHYGHVSSRDYVAADERVWADSKNRNWKQIVGGKKGGATLVLARGEQGRAVELYRKDDAYAVARKLGHKWASPQRARSGADPIQAKFRAKQKEKTELAGVLVAQIVSEAESRLLGPGVAKMIAGVIADNAWADTVKRVLKRRGIDAAKYKATSGMFSYRTKETVALMKHAETLGDAGSFGLLVELAVSRGAYDGHDSAIPRSLKAACDLFGVDVELARKQAKESKKLGAKKGARAADDSKAEDLPGVCRVCGCTDEEGCPEGCSWVNVERTLCSSCEEKPAKKSRGKKR